ncbi:MAG: ABC transporter ATP-binding protein [Clostridia bacterium]
MAKNSTSASDRKIENASDRKIENASDKKGNDAKRANVLLKANNPAKTLKTIFRYMLHGYKLQFCLVVVSIIVSALTSVASAMFLRPLIDDYIVPYIGVSNPDLSGFISAIITIGGVYVVGVLANFLYNRLMLNISNGSLKTVRDHLFTHMQTLPIKYYDNTTHGNLMSRFTTDTDTLHDLIATAIPQSIASVVTVVGVLAAMFYTNWLLTLVVLVVMVFMVYILKFIAKHSSSNFIKQQRSVGALNGYVEEMIGGQKVVKVFNHEDEAEENFDKINDELCKNSSKANGYANILMPIMNNISFLHYVVTAIIGGVLITKGFTGLTIGGLIAFLTLTRSFSRPLTELSQLSNAIIMAIAGAERIFEVTEAPSEENNGKITLVSIDDKGNETTAHTGKWAWKKQTENGAEYTELKGEVVFKDVTFGYTPEKNVLEKINIYAEDGYKIAFVGSTGAGKTTITNLINRFYDINSGEILYDGINIMDIDKNSLRRSLGFVLQDTHLFTGSIMDNIRYGNLVATDEQVIASAKLAGADSFIEKLEKGYQTEIKGDGDNLSQGQRQLLAIARAAVADSPVLVLDEATSSIDTRTESIIEEGMDKLMKGRTVFIIAHRLSTVHNAHEIMVLEYGKIVERGNHEALMKQKGKYYQLYEGKFELN